MKTFTKQELDKILDNHKFWLSSSGKKGKRADLSSANLRYANLSYADLSYADLSSADLSCANLISANLSYADLRYADLSYAALRSADLSCAALRSANLSSANLSYANLSNANLSYANLSNANLRSANLRSANLDFSAFPLCCGGLAVNIDNRIAIQLLYHFVRNVKNSPYTSKELKSLCRLKSVINQANKFHRVDECGFIDED